MFYRQSHGDGSAAGDMDFGPSVEGVPAQRVLLGIFGSLRQDGDISITIGGVGYLKCDARGVAADNPRGNMVKDSDFVLIRLDVYPRILCGME